MNFRQQSEALEAQTLSPYACLSADSKGRRRPEEPCSIRPAFQHDRDRILHSKSFRRLKYKTQVFLSPTGDHYRTRLTHTLEVSQIARTIAKALRLNQDLTEAVALGHDLGHTPFGHAGEEVLDSLLPGGFRHQEQSLRVVDLLEKEGQGLNLTFEVREGILKHSKGRMPLLPENPGDLAVTPEGQVVRLSDVIAYLNHDLDDALRAGIITEGDLPPLVVQTLGTSYSRRIGTMVESTIIASWESPRIKIAPPVLEAMEVLRTFLFEQVYLNPHVHGEFTKASRILKELYDYYLVNFQEIPAEINAANRGNSRELAVADFIAGMTDRYALQTYQRLFMPEPWIIF